MKHIPITNPEVLKKTSDVQRRLLEVASKLGKSSYVVDFIGPEAVSKLCSSLSEEDGLFEFARELRNQVSTGLKQINFDSSLYWKMIDAIWFMNDARPGSWPYVNDNDRLRYLGWSQSMADEVHAALEGDRQAVEMMA